MLTLILKANTSCNLRCSYCSVGDKTRAGMMTESEMTNALLWFAGLARERGEAKPSIIFHGGEPLLIPAMQYRHCLEELFARNPDLTFTLNIQTNGTLLNEEILSLLTDYDITPGVSLDGPENVHDSQRRDVHDRDTYARILSNAVVMRSAGIRSSALMVLTRNSLNAGLEYLRDFSALSLPLKINPLYCAGSAVKHRELLLRSGEYAEYLIRVFEYVIDNEIDISITPIEYILHAVINSSTPRGCVFSADCSSSFVCVSCDGSIYPCGRYADDRINSIGNVNDGGISCEGLEILRLLREARTTHLNEECLTCRYKSLCNGGCPAMNGSMCRDFVKFLDYIYSDGIRKYKGYLLHRREEIIRSLDNAV